MKLAKEIKINTNYNIHQINSEDLLIVQRLNELGLYSGLDFKILNILSFGSVYILQFEDSIVALNKMEMSCLNF